MPEPNKQNLSPAAAEVVQHALALAADANQRNAGTAHLLFSLLSRLRSEPKGKFLFLFGVNYSWLAMDAVKLAAKYPSGDSGTVPEFDEPALRALRRSEEESRATQHSFQNLEHLLLGLLSVGDAVSEMLELAVQSKELRAELLKSRDYDVVLAKEPVHYSADQTPILVGAVAPESADPLVVEPLRLAVDAGSAPPEVVADILSDISLLYRLSGGSGVTFESDIHVAQGEHHE